MNREIKFKANLLTEDQVGKKIEFLVFTLGEITNWFEDDGVFYVKEIPLIIETICQYIGLHDKNEKGIFHFDILEDEMKQRYLIEFDNYEAKFVLKRIDGDLKGTIRHIVDVKVMNCRR